MYQNVYALEPGSAEMPSAGRPFTTELITRLVAGGVLVAPIVLHTGVSSQERHERPYAERYRVPPQTARLVNAVHGWGGRVIATGTTVVRALETVAQPDGVVEAGEGWTNLIVTPERGIRAVDGLITGLHELESSHLDMLRALGGERDREVVQRGPRARLPLARVRRQPAHPRPARVRRPARALALQPSRAHSSAGERSLHTREVPGSIPGAPIKSPANGPVARLLEGGRPGEALPQRVPRVRGLVQGVANARPGRDMRVGSVRYSVCAYASRRRRRSSSLNSRPAEALASRLRTAAKLSDQEGCK